jgi:hypothetical protein
MSERAIERSIRDAYGQARQIGAPQGDRILLEGRSGDLTIRMWLNRVTEMIETAYPVHRR